jgi:putative membrane protein
MNELVLVRYLHFIGLLLVVATVFAEAVLLKKVLKRSVVQTLFKIDGIYGLSALIVVGAGLYLWFGIGKPADYYSSNPIFITKVVLFLVVGILSIWPTVFYFKNRKGSIDDEVNVPTHISFILKVELFILFIIPLLATSMAQGVGL